MTGLLNYVPGDTILHRLDARTKLILPILICVASVAAKGFPMLLAILAVDLLLGTSAGQLRQTLQLLKTLVKVSVFIFVLQVLFVRRGTPVFTLGISITDEGLTSAAKVVLRLIGATMPLATLLTLTRMSDLTTAMVAKWRVPYKYAFAVTSAIRFVPTFMLDMGDIMEAQTARGVEMDTKNPFKKLALVLPLCAPLLISSVKRIDSVALAAEMRGFNLRPKGAGGEGMKMGVSDFSALALGALLIAAALVA
jgi:energy-coupling factor transport system permease protein